MGMRRCTRSASWPRHAVVALAFAAAAWAGSAVADAYAVLSLVGDRMTIVTQGPKTGSHLDQDVYDVLPVTVPALDNVALAAAEAAIRKSDPAAPITHLRASDRTLYTLVDGWLDPDAAALRALVSFVAKAVPAAKDARLLLILPYRTEPQFLTYFGYRGSGSVGGLGFYLGASTVDREAINGFLGVFANLQLVLVDPRSGAIEAHEAVIAGNAYSAARSKGVWDALSAERKIEALQTLTQGEIERRVSAMVASAR